MALPPISSGLPSTSLRPITPARGEAAMAAQRAFFQAALSQTQAAAPTTTATATPARPVTRVAPTAPTAEEPQDRFLRPGSLLDIRV